MEIPNDAALDPNNTSVNPPDNYDFIIYNSSGIITEIVQYNTINVFCSDLIIPGISFMSDNLIKELKSFYSSNPKNFTSFIGNKEKMDETKNKILSFANQTNEGKAASTELVLEN